ncbi:MULTISPECIES: sensor domain-containing protein [Stenotrophomonas]|uniref:Transmembrane protein n=2 Tax=Stenotrophomonas acidaminiphila TaxID=128780 RepID=A0A0S1B1F0_9GAMM|nr:MULTISPECIES: sensor domain-containing protein [Stenotrophomonas]ALJ28862.1 transmembrane protein [Stenotrophomonas acidaminiphila]MCA7022786.1 sensor domain-containing protein [Stenotrophomonas acidaminiphila]
MNNETNARPLPTTIPEYLEQLRAALAGADPAMIQDALYDAEEYLRSELAEQPGKSEADVIAGVAGSYGAPEEVAEIYRETEVTVNRALRTPLPGRRPLPPPVAAVAPGVAVAAAPAGPVAAKPRSAAARFFGVVLDPHTYGALFYMLLSLVTGVFFFTWVVTGLSLSVSLMILIIGIPVLLLFLGSVRVLSLVEGRIIEALLGVRMPRRPMYTDRSQGWLARIGAMFTDVRTWLTMLYFVLMLPLGVVYFSIATTLLSTSLALVFAPLADVALDQPVNLWINDVNMGDGVWLWPLAVAAGLVLLFATLHLARAIGRLHGAIAKHLLVRL